MNKHCLLATIFVMLITSTTALAEKKRQINVSTGSVVTLEDAVQSVKDKYPGKVLNAEKIESKGPKVFRVKLLLPKGRIKSVFVDGVNGEVFEP